jgi:hypothetical protein
VGGAGLGAGPDEVSRAVVISEPAQRVRRVHGVGALCSPVCRALLRCRLLSPSLSPPPNSVTPLLPGEKRKE